MNPVAMTIISLRKEYWIEQATSCSQVLIDTDWAMMLGKIGRRSVNKFDLFLKAFPYRHTPKMKKM